MNTPQNLYCRAWQYLFEIVTVAKNDCILTDSDRGRCQRTFLRPKRHADPERDDHCRNRYTDPAFPIVEDRIRTGCDDQSCQSFCDCIRRDHYDPCRNLPVLRCTSCDPSGCRTRLSLHSPVEARRHLVLSKSDSYVHKKPYPVFTLPVISDRAFVFFKYDYPVARMLRHWQLRH